MGRLYGSQGAASALSGVVMLMANGAVAGSVPANDFNAVVFQTFADDTTFQNKFTENGGSEQRWTIDAEADSFVDDRWERPVQQGFSVRENQNGDEVYATDGDYFDYIDIVQAQLGWDDQFLYAGIELHGPDRSKPNGQVDNTGLVGEYRIELGGAEGLPDGQGGLQGGLLFEVQDPKSNRDQNNNDGVALNDWRTERNFVYRDTDKDLDISEFPVDGLQDNGSGYEEELVNDGVLKDNSGDTPVFTRIKETTGGVLGGNTVQFVIDYAAFDLNQADLAGLSVVFEANRGNSSSEAPDNYLISRQFRFTQAGSPYRCGSGNATSGDQTLANGLGFSSCDSDKSIVNSQGLVDVNEVDNLRGVAAIPLPGAVGLLGGGLALLAFMARRRR